jgi:predicted transposase/invertase (TIGR01784 family)
MTQNFFADPMEDLVAKHLLADEAIRNSCLSSLAGIKIISSEMLDQHLHPIDEFKKPRKLLNSFDMTEHKVFKKEGRFKVTDQEGREYHQGTRLFNGVINNFPLFKKAIPPVTKQSVDILCKIQDESYVTVEFQVSKQLAFTQRALYYLTGVYHKQDPGKNYDQLRPVIAVNLLGGRNETSWDEHRFFRHFVFKDRCSTDELEELTLIQYSLRHLNKFFAADLSSEIDFNFRYKKKDMKKLQEWLSFFEGASHLEKKPKTAFKDIDAAYERIISSRIESENPDIFAIRRYMYKYGKPLFTEEEKKELLETGEQKGREEEKRILVQRLLTLNKSDDEICLIADIEMHDLIDLKKLLNN